MSFTLWAIGELLFSNYLNSFLSWIALRNSAWYIYFQYSSRWWFFSTFTLCWLLIQWATDYPAVGPMPTSLWFNRGGSRHVRQGEMCQTWDTSSSSEKKGGLSILTQVQGTGWPSKWPPGTLASMSWMGSWLRSGQKMWLSISRALWKDWEVSATRIGSLSPGPLQVAQAQPREATGILYS